MEDLKENGKPQLFPGKIGVVTTVASVNEDDYYSTERLLKKYGPEKIIHVTWPENFIVKQEQMFDTLVNLAKDSEIKAIIINQAVEGSNAAVDKLKETRNDIFIVYCNTNEDIVACAARANLVLMLDRTGMGQPMVMQAKKQGAKTFIYYSFPRHMSFRNLSAQRDMIRKTCEEEGILFVPATAPDPTDKGGIAAAHKFILEDVPKMVGKYGKDTAFHSTNCQMQIPLIKAVLDSRAIFPQPCCPSPFHGFPEAFGIDRVDGMYDLRHLVNEICSIAAEKGMTDRLSTLPVSNGMMFTTAGAEYAIAWIKGEVEKTWIDNDVLIDCMNAYIKEVVGEESHILMTSFSDGGRTYDNIKPVIMSYLDF